MRAPRREWPGGRRFAFSVCDDTDDATVDNVRPVYDLLGSLGLRTTKTVWVLPSAPESGGAGQSLRDPDYREFVRGLMARGFGVGLHGVRDGDATREEIEEGLREYAEVLGIPPTLHVNHFRNRDNVHWGNAWLPWWRFGRGDPGQDFEGDRRGSPHFWGDLCLERIRYVRGRVFPSIDTLGMDPWMPYHEPRFPWVRAWFSSSDGANADRFVRLLSRANLDRLERAGGCCIVYTHFSKGFVGKDGAVRGDVESALRGLAARDGWFAPVEEVLRFLERDPLPRLGPLRRTLLDARVRWDWRRHGEG